MNPPLRPSSVNEVRVLVLDAHTCVTAADANNWTAVATYQNADPEADKCSTFQLDGRGVRTSTPDTDCWSRTR